MAVDGFEWATHPSCSFKDQWEGHGDFLGTGAARRVERTTEEWVHVAEVLMSEHGGVLPCNEWLCRNKMQGLAVVMRKNPELFTHIVQDKPYKTPDEWVRVAEGLAEENGGVLPSVAWIAKSRHSGLLNAMRKHAGLFAHLDQEKKQLSPEDWVAAAEDLAAKHGGILPCPSWLNKNRYSGLAKALAKRPELFAHIDQEKKLKKPEEWIPFAESLAKAYGDALPCIGWLLKDGHIGLVSVMREHPSLFQHIPQEFRNSQGDLIGIRVNGKTYPIEGDAA